MRRLALAVAFVILAGAAAAHADCRPIPRGKRIIQVSLKPDVPVVDVVHWYGNISCATLVYRGEDLAGKKVTITSPGELTLEEVERLVFLALDSVGLRAEREGDTIRVSVQRKR